LVHVHVNPEPGRAVSSKFIDLWTHKGDSHTKPSYGRGEPVDGYVDLKVFDHIAEIEVTVHIYLYSSLIESVCTLNICTDMIAYQLQGTLEATYSARGVAHDTTSLSLFTETKLLYTSAFGQAPGRSFPFTFTFPEKCTGSDNSLPPTWRLFQPVRASL
jgi:hypothetical protein